MAGLFVGCGNDVSIARPGKVDNTVIYEEPPQYEEGVLLAIVENEEQAKEIAESCGITLESVSYNMAKYITDENLDTVIERAKNIGVTLEKNMRVSAY